MFFFAGASSSRKSSTPEKKQNIIPLHQIQNLEYAEGGVEIVLDKKLIGKLDFGEIVPFIHKLVYFALLDYPTHVNIEHIKSGKWLTLISRWLFKNNYDHTRFMRSASEAVRRIEDREKALKNGQPIFEPRRPAISVHEEDAPTTYPYQETSNGFIPHRPGFEYIYGEDPNLGHTPRLNEAQRLELMQKQRIKLIVSRMRKREHQLEQIQQQLHQLKLYRQQQKEAGKQKPYNEEKFMAQKLHKEQNLLLEEHQQLKTQYVLLEQQQEQLLKQKREEQHHRHLYNQQKYYQHLLPGQFNPHEPNNPYNQH